eukprot:m.57934 g.57934  ORF g.57934 m.57934 type:complete len:86 (+) comp11142_c0_seq2:1185-1442(+)
MSQHVHLSTLNLRSVGNGARLLLIYLYIAKEFYSCRTEKESDGGNSRFLFSVNESFNESLNFGTCAANQTWYRESNRCQKICNQQ